MDSKIASKFRGRFSAVGACHCNVLTRLYEWFVGNGGWSVGFLAAELSPSCYKVIVTMKDQTPFLARHGMFSCEAVATAIASRRKCSWFQTLMEVKAISELVS
jgi:hypothetical protein